MVGRATLSAGGPWQAGWMWLQRIPMALRVARCVDRRLSCQPCQSCLRKIRLDGRAAESMSKSKSKRGLLAVSGT